MNQPTEDRFKRLEEEQRQLKEEVRRLREQITEPIRIDRLEIDRGGTQELLKETNKKLEKIIQTQTDRSERFDTFERGLQDLKQELHTLSDNWLDSLQENVDEFKAGIANIKATQSDHGEMLKSHGEMLKAMATKDDIATLKTTQDRQESLLQEILSRLPPKS